MKRLALLFLAVTTMLFTACDPKVDQRAPRYSSDDCPVCHSTGECTYCHGDGKCQYCKGTGTRVSSTKNYTGETGVTGADIKLVDIEEPCPFCNGTGKCPNCKGSKKCSTCEGSGKVKNWNFLKGKK